MRFYVLKDQSLIGETSTKEEAVEMIHAHQKRETHYLLRAEFSIIEGKPQEFIGYPERRSKG